MKKLIVSIFLLASTVASADQGNLSLIVTGLTDHFSDKTYYDNSSNSSKNKNGINYGVGLSYEVIDNLYVGGGAYKNSINQTSGYAAVGYKFFKYDAFSLTISESIANGYSQTKTNYVKYPSGMYSKTSYNTSNNYESTSLIACYKTELTEAHSPSVCLRSPVFQSSGTPFNQVNLSVVIPLTNLLQD